MRGLGTFEDSNVPYPRFAETLNSIEIMRFHSDCVSTGDGVFASSCSEYALTRRSTARAVRWPQVSYGSAIHPSPIPSATFGERNDGAQPPESRCTFRQAADSDNSSPSIPRPLIHSTRIREREIPPAGPARTPGSGKDSKMNTNEDNPIIRRRFRYPVTASPAAALPPPDNGPADAVPLGG